ncbi:uncharacterized protein BXZ73DRAFT_78222 [Epithele typhae]|uniref:uncharacterized protein n=1 Tax=Epithele typhae TaxID=378194 RepID=UPI0020082A65|nr:uncharacterized protein BXZ73DRAFT_78222 [Epithele typhae]KAH9929078.1 hypothetical protein BXZ73DRAFT_78222 [Epithele typhae]
MNPTRLPPSRPGEQPPTYRMVTRVYKSSLRPVVIILVLTLVLAPRYIVGSLTAIWALILAIPAFNDINADKQNGWPKFAVFDIALGVIYVTVCAIEVFGLMAAVTQRIPLVRLYAMMSILAAILTVGASFFRVIIHFIYKNDLISECTDVVQGKGVTFRFGIWGPRVHETLNAAEAQAFCTDAWNKDSFNEIISLIFEIFFSIFFTMITFAYYHQVLDPTSPANVQRGPMVTSGPQPAHWNAPYDPNARYDAPPYPPYGQPQYAPPPGPPPTEMGYGAGMGVGADKDRDMKDHDDASETTKYDDPFADFDEGPSKPAASSAHPPAY